jgi:hypothetical protein
MAMVGTIRYIYFRLADSFEVPITGRVQSDFAVTFTRNNLAPPDVITIAEIGAGRYYASYTPTTQGEDYVEIYDAPTDTRVEDVEQIQSPSDFQPPPSYIALDQDYPTTGALTVTEVASPETYTLYVFEYDDWQIGNQLPAYARGQSELNSDGSWASTIYVVYGAYTVVVRNGTSTVVIRPYLNVASGLGEMIMPIPGPPGPPGPTGPTGPAGGGGGGAVVVVSKSAAYTAASGQMVLCTTTGAGFTVTLPAPTVDSTVSVKKVSVDSNTVTIVPSSGQIDGSSTLIVSAFGSCVDLVADGSAWWIY